MTFKTFYQKTALLAIFNVSRSLEPSTSLLLKLDKFRTLDWVKIREELDILKQKTSQLADFLS